MGMLEDLLLRVNPGAGFPAIAEPPVDPVDEAAQAEAARAAWAAKMRGAQKRETPFGAPAVPFGALAPSMGLPAEFSQQPAAPSAAPEIAAPPAPQFDGPVPLPRERPKEADGAPTGVMPTDVSSATAQPPAAPPVAPAAAAAPVAAPEPSGFGSLASGLMSGLKNNSATLLALGAGFAGAPNIGQGISRAASAAIPASQADLKNRMTLDSQKQTLQALLAKKIPLADALAAISNPDVMKATVAKYFETKPLQHVMQKDALGADVPMTFDPNTGKYRDAAGVEVKAADPATGGVSGGIVAPGVKFDPNKTGQERFDQYSDDVKTAAKAYMNGDVMPSGNPRQKSLQTFAKTVAQRLGEDTGIPVNDNTYNAKRTMITDYAKATPSSAGGQRNAGNTAIAHLGSVSDAATKLGNVSLPGGVLPDIAGWVNWARQKGTEDQKAKANALASEVDKYVTEVARFYAGSGSGGVHEREAARQRFNTTKTGPELAAAIQAESELMHGKMDQLRQVRDNLLGEQANKLTGGPVVLPHAQDAMKKIEQNLRVLRGEASAAPEAPPSGKTGSGVTWSVVQ